LGYENDIDSIYNEEDFLKYVREKNKKIHDEINEAYKKTFNTTIDDEGIIKKTTGNETILEKTVNNEVSIEKEAGDKSNLEKNIDTKVILKKPANTEVELINGLELLKDTPHNYSKILKEHHEGSKDKKKIADGSFFHMAKVIPFNDAIYEDESVGMDFRKRQLDIKNSKESFFRKLKLSIKMFKTNRREFKRFKRGKEDENFAKKKAQIVGKKQKSRKKKEITPENDYAVNKIKKKYRKFKGFKKSSIIGYGVKKSDYKNNKEGKLNFKEVEAPFFPNP